jgi:hypothetical protein
MPPPTTFEEYWAQLSRFSHSFDDLLKRAAAGLDSRVKVSICLEVQSNYKVMGGGHLVLAEGHDYATPPLDINDYPDAVAECFAHLWLNHREMALKILSDEEEKLRIENQEDEEKFNRVLAQEGRTREEWENEFGKEKTL